MNEIFIRKQLHLLSNLFLFDFISGIDFLRERIETWKIHLRSQNGMEISVRKFAIPMYLTI